MPHTNIDRLRSIKTLPSLVAYLRDELDWPIDSDDVEEISYSYESDELGLDADHAAKINQIKQIRPLYSGQPWGIFWVSFEKKRLPVVVLRRILANLVVKSRQSANSADRPRWKMHDLLFISAYGDEDTAQREIAFAHFRQSDGDLPTLHVLGWDGADTVLKLDHVAHILSEKLHWPKNPAHIEEWRQQWNSAFRHRIGHVIRTADSLAEVLAALARNIRGAASNLLTAESDKGVLTKLYKAFQTGLIHDLTPEAFADTYAQTITYGLLTAAISRTEMSEGRHGTALIAENILDMVPVTNPFLKEMLQTFLHAGGRKGGIDFDELGIQDVVELLRGAETDLPAVLRDFGNKTRGEDPVIHFYEHFLSAYNKRLKIQRGVFYTPQPVVSYIVRSVHKLLQTEFGLVDGLADTTTWAGMLKKHSGLKLPPLTDEPGEKRTISAEEPFVQILDPATGTATFLVEVIDIIYQTLAEKWKLQRFSDVQVRAAWNDYVPKHLLPRLHAFELMMAPYAIAHMKIGLKLAETGYRFGTKERARIYLTNALEPKVKQLPQIGFDALAHEAAAVNEIKWYKRFTVVVGNPPYSLVSANMKREHRALVERFKFIGGERIKERGALQLEKILNDDYVKFIAKSEDCLSATGVGILGLITNHAYLDNPTMRGLRHSLTSNFNRAFVYDLGGSAKKISGDVDENVFDIQQGVAIGVFVRNGAKEAVSNVHARLLGTRENKYCVLGASSCAETQWSPLSPTQPFFLLVPTDYILRSEYEKFTPLSEIFVLKSIGLFTSKDSLVIDWTADAVEQKVHAFQRSKLSNSDLCEQVGITAKDAWNVTKSRERLAGIRDLSKHIVRFLHRPFDFKYLFYERSLVWSMAWPVNRNLIARGNLAFTVSRQLAAPPWNHIFCSNTIVELCYITNKTKEGNHVFPLYVLPDEDAEQQSLAGNDSRRTNFHPLFIAVFLATLGFGPSERDGYPAGLTPEDIFQYAYATFHSADYRNRYEEFLKIDFPRLPLTANLELFRVLSGLGRELIAVHLLESPRLEKPVTEFIGGRTPTVEKVTWSKNTVWIDNAQTIGFKGVKEEVWNLRIGAYQVCEKWLRDRKGRRLLKDDIEHYQRAIAALFETLRLMTAIDAVIEEHGGWPGAFATAASASIAVPDVSSSRLGSTLPDNLGMHTEDELPLS